MWGGTKSRVHVTADVVSLGSPCFLICNSLSPDVHQFFPRLHHFNRLCFPERRLVIENTNLLLQTSSCVYMCVCVCVWFFCFGERQTLRSLIQRGTSFVFTRSLCVCVCLRACFFSEGSEKTGQNSKWRRNLLRAKYKAILLFRIWQLCFPIFVVQIPRPVTGESILNDLYDQGLINSWGEGAGSTAHESKPCDIISKIKRHYNF